MGVSNPGDGSSDPPTYAVRFESSDDFLVAYADHLRHGFIRLPLPGPVRADTRVRLRVRLPDETILYLTGHAVRDDGVGGSEGTRIRLDTLSGEQREAIQRCVEALVGHDGAEDSGVLPIQEPIEVERLSVLLVDDSVTQRLELGDGLRSRGLRVRVAENGLLALSAALKRPPDVVLTDVEMPQMDGWSLLRTIRQRKRLVHVPVIFLTRLSDEFSRLRGYRMGVDDYLPKTMPVDEVVARLYGAVARRRQLPALAGTQGLRGDLEHVRLGSLLAFLETERRTGALALQCGSDTATLHLHEGTLLGVDNLGRYQHPHDRVFELLGWAFGQFEFVTQGSSPPREDAAELTPLSYLLMEHARRTDEANA